MCLLATQSPRPVCRGDTTNDGAAGYGYDALGRLYAVGRTRFLYDGADLIGEYDLSGALVRRYVHGPGVDEPLVAYDGARTGSRRWLLADERGSVVGSSDAAGSVASAALDDYGRGAPVSRFGFTGQAWLPEAGVYHFKARAYSPRLGRFLQPDPSADPDSPSLYAYVGNDPVNMNDPTGLGGAGICLLGDTAGCNNQSLPPPIAQVVVTAPPAQIQRAAELRADAATFGVLIQIPMAGISIAPIGEAFQGLRATIRAFSAIRTAARKPMLASKPIGRRGNPLQVKRGLNASGIVDGRKFSGHSFDQMQGRGVMPSAVENAIRTGVRSSDPIPGRIRFYDPVNNITVVTASDGEVVTVMTGKR